MGELHLEVNIHRLHTDFNVDVTTGPPEVFYCETISQTGTAHYRHKKQSGGPGQFAEVEIQIDPLARGEGIQFESNITSGRIPKEYIPSVEKGIRQAAKQGIVQGFPVVDFKITLCDGRYHENDSSPLAFEWAGKMAFREAAVNSTPLLLEPIMLVNVITPSEYMGLCIGALNRRLARVQTLERNTANIVALVPLVTMFGYIGDLRALSSGRAVYNMHFDHYGVAIQ